MCVRMCALLLVLLGVVQQREDMAARNRPIRVRERQQAARGQQERPHDKEGYVVTGGRQEGGVVPSGALRW